MDKESVYAKVTEIGVLAKQLKEKKTVQNYSGIMSKLDEIRELAEEVRKEINGMDELNQKEDN